MIEVISGLKPYGVADLVDFDTLLKNDEFYPFSKEGDISQEKVVDFFLKMGFVYNSDYGKWYQLGYDGLYHEIREESVNHYIMIFLDHHARKNGFNFPTFTLKNIYERLKGTSYHELETKRDRFLTDHDEYCLSWDNPEFIPVMNGLIHPESMELLPHCAYYLYPYVFGFNYTKMTEEEIRFSPFWDIYADILPDTETLEYYLWWAGMVLFSEEMPRLILFLYGDSGTGKTTLSLGLTTILTSYKYTQLDNSMMKSEFITSTFVNKKLIVCDEMPQTGGLWDDSLFKKLAGGNPVFTINPKHKQLFNAPLNCKLMLMGNSYPPLTIDNAVLDRIHIIPCNKKQDQSIRNLITSNEGLNWLFNASYLFYVEKHPHKNVNKLSDLKTKIMLEEQEKLYEMDGFIFWLKDYLGVSDLNREMVRESDRLIGVPVSTVYNHYKEYTRDTGGSPLSNRQFNLKLRSNYGIVSKPMRDSTRYEGVYRGYDLEGGTL